MDYTMATLSAQSNSPHKIKKKYQVNRPAIYKCSALTELEQGKSRSQVAKRYQVAESTLRGWIKDKEDIFKKVNIKSTSIQESIIRLQLWLTLEKTIPLWKELRLLELTGDVAEECSAPNTKGRLDPI